MDETTPATTAQVATAPSAGPHANAAEAAHAALKAAQAAVASLTTDTGGGAKPLNLPSIAPAAASPVREAIDLLADVNLHVKIELGRTRMLVEDVLRLGEGSVVELDKLAGDPVDIYVNDRPVARGEVLVLNDNFCVRINEIVSQGGAGIGNGGAIEGKDRR
jgi:flagellar motor switch protein FliN/FliY